MTFDDAHAVDDAGLVLPATLASDLCLRELFDDHVDLGDTPAHANVGDKAMTLMAGTGDVVHCRQRGGNANSGRGAGTFLTETFKCVRAAEATGALTIRADSGFDFGAVAAACRAAEVRLSITVRLNPAIRRLDGGQEGLVVDAVAQAAGER